MYFNGLTAVVSKCISRPNADNCSGLPPPLDSQRLRSRIALVCRLSPVSLTTHYINHCESLPLNGVCIKMIWMENKQQIYMICNVAINDWQDTVMEGFWE